MTALQNLFEISPLTDAFDALAARVRSSVVAVQNGRRGGGSGVVWSGDGLVITNEHVVAGSDLHQIITADGRKLRASVVARDPENDLAALRVDDSAGLAAEIGDSRALRVGQLVIAIGHPLGVEHAMTAGIVSGTPFAGARRELIQSHLLLNPGNSGGPLLDAHGRVIGINAMVSGPRTALSIPSQVVQAFVARAVRQTPPFGVELQLVELPVAYRSGLPTGQVSGVLITGVAPGSRAEQTGLYPGDIVVSVNGAPVASPYRLRDEILLLGPDAECRLRVLRGGLLTEIATRQPVAA